MCLQVFVASDKPLPVVSDESPRPVFQTEPVWAGALPVLRLFTKPHVLALTAVGGCACGFRYSPDDLDILAEVDVPDEIKNRAQADYEASRESVRLLKAYLCRAAHSKAVEVYNCWYGDEAAEPETSRKVTTAHFGGDAFHFIERQLLTVNPAAED